jgi:hypothetical protein
MTGFKSTAPLADVLAGVDRAQRTAGIDLVRSAPGELRALRELAEAVRAHLLARPEGTGTLTGGLTGRDLRAAAVSAGEPGERGQCEFCMMPDVLLVAALSADPDVLVCETCHADPRVPTVALAVLADDRPAWVISRGDLAGMAGRAVTDAEVARIAKAIGYSTATEAVGDAVAQVCGYPEEAGE